MSDLHIPNLTIKNFRGIDDLWIPHLGRVTLVVGRNGVGKTNVLDAIRAYATRGAVSDIWNLLEDRDEIISSEDEDDEPFLEPDWSALFYDHQMDRSIIISTEQKYRKDQLSIEYTTAGFDNPDSPDAAAIPVLRVGFRDRYHEIPWVYMPDQPLALSRSRRERRRILRRLSIPRIDQQPFDSILINSLGPETPSNQEIARYWEKVALTPAAKVAMGALELVYASGVDGIAMLGMNRGLRNRNGIRPVIKLFETEARLPLRRLGEGAIRLFGLALALSCSQGGILVVDEIENGIHYTVHPEMWEMVLRIAKDHDVQVIATTHGWDCSWGFAQAMRLDPDSDGTVVRIDQSQGGLTATEFRGDDLDEIAEQQLEIR